MKQSIYYKISFSKNVKQVHDFMVGLFHLWKSIIQLRNTINHETWLKGKMLHKIDCCSVSIPNHREFSINNNNKPEIELWQFTRLVIKWDCERILKYDPKGPAH